MIFFPISFSGDVSNAELLALLGGFGFLFSAIQAAALEHAALRAAPWDVRMAGPLLLYVAAMLAFYSLVRRVSRLQRSFARPLLCAASHIVCTNDFRLCAMPPRLSSTASRRAQT